MVCVISSVVFTIITGAVLMLWYRDNKTSEELLRELHAQLVRTGTMPLDIRRDPTFLERQELWEEKGQEEMYQAFLEFRKKHPRALDVFWTVCVVAGFLHIPLDIIGFIMMMFGEKLCFPLSQ